MKSPEIIVLNHANKKAELNIVLTEVVAFWYDEAHACTLLMFSGGGMLPVKESVETITKAKENPDG